MSKSAEEYYLENCYSQAIYNGICHEIEFCMKHDLGDMRKELTYMVNRYCKEEVVSGKYLRDKLDEYCKVAAEKYGEEQESE